LVLKSQDLKENDKIITLFTEKLGKISAVAKGAKKSKNKFMSLSLPFCYGSYVVFKGKNLYTLNEGEITKSFQSLLNDLETLSYASYVCELIDIALVEEESNGQLFKEFITVFYLMEKRVIDIELLIHAFEIKLLYHSGYYMQLENCVICKSPINTSDYINLQYLGGVCKECGKAHSMKISFSTYNSLKYLIRTSIENVYKLSLSNESKAEMSKLLSYVISDSFGRKPKSLETYNFLKGVGINE